tara:strand:- start:104 stop:283 length:180 start_codon:yes stop_codon:yes gene_type:complete
MIHIGMIRDGVEITPSCNEEVNMDKWLESWAEEAIEIENLSKKKPSLMVMAISLFNRRW